MMNDVISTSNDCRSCAEARGTRYKTQKPMKLFPASKPLDFIAMDLLGPLPATESGKAFILVITDRFSKLAQVTPLASTTAPVVADAFVSHWVIPYGLPTYLLTDNGPQFVAKFFEAVCVTLSLNHVTTTAYHPQTNGQTERYNHTLATRLHIFTNENHKKWDRLIEPLTYAYNCQVHRTTNETPFSLVLTRPPPDIVVKDDDSFPTTDDLSPEDARLKVMERSKALVAQAAKRTSDQQAKYKHYHDRKVRSVLQLAPGDEVFLDFPPSSGQSPAERLAAEPLGKLRKKTQAAYKVTQVMDGTARIVDSDGIEDVVSLDRLTRAPPPLDPTTLQPLFWESHTPSSPPRAGPAPPEDLPSSPLPLASPPASSSSPLPPSANTPTTPPVLAQKSTEDSQEYVVDRIKAHRPSDDKYLVKWYGYEDPSEDTWEPADHIPANMRTRFHRQQQQRAER